MRLLRNIYNRFGSIFYLLSGQRPWSFGYTSYKRKKIAEYISSHRFNPDKLPDGYGFRLDERIIEYPWLFSRLPASAGTLLDAGSVLNYDYLLKQPNLSDKKLFISTLSPESDCFWRKGISYVFEDLRRACYRDEFFNWIVCLSTIEHIGLDNTFLYTTDKTKNERQTSDYLDAILEMRRILKPGGTLFLSFPFGKKKDHGWFQVFDDTMCQGILKTFRPVHVDEKCFAYTPSGWRVSSKADSAEAEYFDININSKYDPDYAAASRAVLCMELTT